MKKLAIVLVPLLVLALVCSLVAVTVSLSRAQTSLTWELIWGLDADPAAINPWQYPEDAVQVTLADVEDTIPDDVSVIWHYAGTTEGWQWFTPGWPESTLDTLEAGKYYIGIALSACQWEIPQEPPPELQVHYIDVGQGDAILVDYGTYEMLIDGGRWTDCAAYIPDYIDGALEVVVATHPDADHIGGLDDVLEAFVVQHIWLNGDTATTQTYADFMASVNAEGAPMHQAQRGDEIGVSTLAFEVLHPTLPLDSDRNENSIVLKLSFGQVDFLFTGDACSDAEASMLAAGLIDDIDILKVGHHGSKYCSTADFLSAAQPEIAIISVGGNPYGHPAPDTISALQDIGATVYGTDHCGTIVVTTDKNNIDIQFERTCVAYPYSPPYSPP